MLVKTNSQKEEPGKKAGFPIPVRSYKMILLGFAIVLLGFVLIVWPEAAIIY